jgi:hypothetical protein
MKSTPVFDISFASDIIDYISVIGAKLVSKKY